MKIAVCFCCMKHRDFASPAGNPKNDPSPGNALLKGVDFFLSSPDNPIYTPNYVPVMQHARLCTTTEKKNIHPGMNCYFNIYICTKSLTGLFLPYSGIGKIRGCNGSTVPARHADSQNPGPAYVSGYTRRRESQSLFDQNIN
jgi:hypothetical protein